MSGVNIVRGVDKMFRVVFFDELFTLSDRMAMFP